MSPQTSEEAAKQLTEVLMERARDKIMPWRTGETLSLGEQRILVDILKQPGVVEAFYMQLAHEVHACRQKT